MATLEMNINIKKLVQKIEKKENLKNKKNMKLTPEYLLNWMDEVEEDPIVDGSFYLSKEQAEEFAENLSDKTKESIVEHYCEPWEDINKRDIGLVDDVEDDILQCFCDIVNKYEIKEI